MARGPWPVGTLLAYHVISNDLDFVRNSELWNKYVLLRVVKLEPFFGSKDKSMAVCLYDWVGESIPDSEIVKDLSFTHICIDKPMLGGTARKYLIDNLKDKSIPANKVDELISNVTKPHVCTFVLLDWRCCKGIDRDDVFTDLGCDPAFVDSTPAIYNENTGGIVLVHSRPFDSTLVRRFCIDKE